MKKILYIIGISYKNEITDFEKVSIIMCAVLVVLNILIMAIIGYDSEIIYENPKESYYLECESFNDYFTTFKRYERITYRDIHFKHNDVVLYNKLNYFLLTSIIYWILWIPLLFGIFLTTNDEINIIHNGFMRLILILVFLFLHIIIDDLFIGMIASMIFLILFAFINNKFRLHKYTNKYFLKHLS